MRLAAPLRHRSFAVLWSGLVLSAAGDQLYTVALTWIAVGILGPAAGYLSALQAGCILVSVLFAGRWVDRFDHRTILLADYTVEAAALLLLVAAWTLTGTPSAPLLVLVVVVLSLGIGVTRPTVQALLPDLLPDRAALPAANALIDSTERVARLGGPFLVGLLAGILPERHFLTLDAVSFIAAAAGAALLPRGPRRPHAVRPALLDTLRRARAAVARDELLEDCWRLAALANGTWMVTFFLCIPLAIERAGAAAWSGSGLGAFGLVIAAYGLASLFALLVVGNRPVPAHPARQIVAARLVMAAGMGIVALGLWLAPPFLLIPACLLGAVVAAPAGPLADIPIATIRQTRTEPGEVAPAVRAFVAANQVGTITGLVTAPTLVASFGFAATVAACALLSALAGLFIARRHVGPRRA